MTYYPVIVPTLNRYEHFKRLVDSLACNKHADKTELVIGLDYPPSEKYMEGYCKIKNYLPTITGFKKITVFTTEINLGQGINSKRLLEYVEKQGYDAYIFSEDDNEFSPCFLDYMNQALNKYKDSEKVLGICGYAYFDYDLENNYFAKAMSAWGWGMSFKSRARIEPSLNIDAMEAILNDWKESIRLFRLRPNSLSALITQVRKNVVYGDSGYVRYCLLNDVYCLFPSKTLVRNWGNDGSGLHCKKDNDKFVNREISQDKEYKLVDIPINEKREIRKLLIKDYTKHWYGNSVILLRYLVWRIIHVDILAFFFNRNK